MCCSRVYTIIRRHYYQAAFILRVLHICTTFINLYIIYYYTFIQYYTAHDNNTAIITHHIMYRESFRRAIVGGYNFVKIISENPLRFGTLQVFVRGDFIKGGAEYSSF